MIPSRTAPLDQPALESLYRKLERPIYNVVYRWLWDAEEAHDVVQETFVRLWGMRERARPESVAPLVYRIAVNLAATRRRSRKLWTWVTLEALWNHCDPAPTGEGHVLSREQARLLQGAMDALPARLKQVVLLCVFSELGYDQIAQALSIPPGTVASRKNQAMRRLRAYLAPYLAEEVFDEPIA